MNWTSEDTRRLLAQAVDRPRLKKWVVRALRAHCHEEGIVERVAQLQSFVDERDGRRFDWGEFDCCLVLADWLMALGQPDSAAHLRDTYETEQQCRAIIAARGGLLAVVGDCAARCGLVPALEPRFGAVAVIGSELNPRRQWGAIWNGTRWLVLWGNDGSTHFQPFAARALKIWAVD